MLQINSGKLFTRGVGRTNRLTGVLYTNARLPHDRDVSTAAGSLRSTGSGPADMAVVYELEERIEETGSGPGVLVSHTVAPYLEDFAVVASFGLGVVVSREPAVVRSLTDGRPGFGQYDAPAKFVARFFEPAVYLTDEEVVAFETFVTELLALERRSYLGVMQAMRTFVAGLHRISDNLGQAYTMMVSAVESLAQDFDGFTPQWVDLNLGRSRPIDEALLGIEASVADEVRQAILLKEHVALARRYRAFVMTHLGEDFVRSTERGVHPIASYELEPAVKKAYDLRSAYVHRLKSLPTALSHPFGHWETTSVDRAPALTFQGMYRVTQQVIRSFVQRQPKVEKEKYDYDLERAGIVQMEMAPQYWVWQPISDPAEVRRRLEGLLSIVASVLMREPGAGFPDMRNALVDIERLLPQASRKHRPAMLSLHFLFNLFMAPSSRSEGFDAFFESNREEAGAPSVDSIAVVTVLEASKDWSADLYSEVLADYFKSRIRRAGLHAPRLIEAAMRLTLAEKLRLESRFDEARVQLVRALEVKPDDERLRALVAKEGLPEEIDWDAILLPAVLPDEGSERPKSDEP